MINTLSKINLSKIGWEGGRSTSIWIMSLNILFVFFESTPKSEKFEIDHFNSHTPINTQEGSAVFFWQKMKILGNPSLALHTQICRQKHSPSFTKRKKEG